MSSSSNDVPADNDKVAAAPGELNPRAADGSPVGKKDHWREEAEMRHAKARGRSAAVRRIARGLRAG